MSTILYLAAAAYARAGKVEPGLQLVTEGIDHLQSTGERWCEAELYRLRGELLAMPRNAGAGGKAKKRNCLREAESWIARAREVARRQAAKLWELRAATSLARLRHAQGRTAEALALLEPITAWFPQGVDSPDLRAASVLLDRLR